MVLMKEYKWSESEVQEVLTHYQLGELECFEPLGGGIINQVIRIKTDFGQYVAKRFHAHIAYPQWRQFDHSIIIYLLENQFPVPDLVRTTDNNTFLYLTDSLYEVFQSIDGQPYDPHNPAHLENVAYWLAQFHQLVKNFSPSGDKEGWHENKEFPLTKRLQESFGEIEKYFEDRGIDCQSNASISAAIKYLRFQAKQIINNVPVTDFTALPKQIIHGDFRTSNLIFHGNQLAGLIDFDNSRIGARIWDVVSILNSIVAIKRLKSVKPASIGPWMIDLEKLKQFLSIYHRYNPLTEGELRFLPYLLAGTWITDMFWNLSGKGISDITIVSGTLENITLFPRSIGENFDWFQKVAEELVSISKKEVPCNCDLVD